VPLPVPPQWLVQLPPVHVGFCPEQGVHPPPLLPHAPLSVPATQLPVTLQHPPLHVSPPAHDVVHVLVETLQALPVGHWLVLLQPQTPFDWHLLPSGDELQSASWTHPQVVPVHAVPSGDDAQLAQCPGIPQLAGVPMQGPPSCGGGGGASDATSGCASMCAAPVSPGDESMADVESIAAPLSTVTTTSSPPVPSPPTLPSLLSSRPAPLRPQAASSTPSTHASPRVEPILDGCTASRMSDPGAPVDGAFFRTSRTRPLRRRARRPCASGRWR
jgi:hypothetical protein